MASPPSAPSGPEWRSTFKAIWGCVVGAVLLIAALAGILVWADVKPPWVKEPKQTGPSSSTPSEIGRSVNVYAYCVYKGFASSRPEQDPGLRTVKDWTCVRTDGSSEPITTTGVLSWDEACQHQYGPDVVATNTDPKNNYRRVRCVRG